MATAGERKATVFKRSVCVMVAKLLLVALGTLLLQRRALPPLVIVCGVVLLTVAAFELWRPRGLSEFLYEKDPELQVVRVALTALAGIWLVGSGVAELFRN